MFIEAAFRCCLFALFVLLLVMSTVGDKYLSATDTKEKKKRMEAKNEKREHEGMKCF